MQLGLGFQCSAKATGFAWWLCSPWDPVAAGGSRAVLSPALVRQLRSVSTESWPGLTSLPSELGCLPNPYTNYPELENSGFCLQETIKPQGSQRFPSALARAASISVFNHISRDPSALQCSPAAFLSQGSLWDTLTGQDPHQALQGLLCCCLLLLLCPGGFRHCWQNSSRPDGFLQQLQVLHPALGAGQGDHLHLQPPARQGEGQRSGKVQLGSQLGYFHP